MSGDGERLWEETAAVVAHELGTPLTVAQAAVEALTRMSADPQAQELAETAARSLRSVELQIGRLRRFQDPVVELDRQPVDLVALTRELIDDLASSILYDHPTSMEAPDTMEVSVDAEQFRLVLYNLLSNAAKYSPSEREIVVGIEQDGDDVVVQVRDRGDGVAPDDAERIFEKYERVGDGVPGAGLGLYLARLVIEAHRGSLRLVPAEGEGSIFEIRLPSASSD